MRKEVRVSTTSITSFTRQELLLFVEKLFDAFFIDCCPSCQCPLNWSDRISDDDIKRKIEELEIEFAKEEHRQRHVELHQNLDELLADCISHNKDFYPSRNTVFDLMQWSHQQTINPEGECERKD